MGIRWRLVEQSRARGQYFHLQKGRGRDRVTLSLGYVDGDDAERALRQVQLEEDGETVGRVLRLYDRSREDAVRYLLGDPVVDELIGPPEPDWGSMRLREYFDEVYAAARAEEAPGGWRQEKRHWALLLDGIGHHRLRQIDEFVFADHLDALRVTRGKRAGKPVSGTTKRLQRAALHAMFKWAYRRRHVVKIPDLGVFRIRGATKAVRDKPDPLSLEELAALLDACGDPRHRGMFGVGAGQGLRPSELVALDWSDVDWEVPALRIRGTKTEASAATIPITPLALRELRAWWERCERPSDGTMFPSKSGEPYASSTGYRKALEAAAKEAGIDRHIYPYLLRDSFATIAWAVGIDKDVARRVLRHTDDKMLDAVYCRPRPAELVEAVAAFDL